MRFSAILCSTATMAALGLNTLNVYSGSGVMNPDGSVDLTMNFRFPVTAEFLQSMETELTAASEILWDATDGQSLLGTITFTCTLQNEDAADIWVYGADGRAGSSSRCTGGSLGRLGDHVTMYVTSRLRSDVIAHELGHLIFGLKDEYGEQRRFGACYGIGPCIETADLTEQNHCLMQQRAPPGSIASEFCTPSRHDAVRGDGLNCEEQAVPHGCEERCEGFNHATALYESTSMTLNCDPDGCWNRIAINFPFMVAPADLPEAAIPADFTAPTFVSACEAVSDTILLALDASGSMNESVDPTGGEICGNGSDDDDDGTIDEADCKESRLSFLKASSRLFLEKLRPFGARVGVISFDCTPTLEAGIQDLDTAFITLRDATQGIAASGGTAIGRALASTPLLFSAEASAVNPSVFLITDGFNTCGEDPSSVVPDLNAVGIRVFTLAAGEAANNEVVTQISADTGGSTMISQDLRSMPALVTQMLAQRRGDGLVIPLLPFALDQRSSAIETSTRVLRTSKAWLAAAVIEPKPVPKNNVFEFEVEDGAQSLTLVLAGGLDNMAGFGVEVALKGPAGSNPAELDSAEASPFLRVVRDEFFVLIEVRSPNPGTWIADVRARPGAGNAQVGTVTVTVENPRTRFFASLDRSVVDDADDTVTLNVLPTFHTALHDLDEISATVIAPDGNTRNVVLTEDADLAEGYSGRISGFEFEGRYEVRVRARTGRGVFNDPGESIFVKDGPSNEVEVPRLERSTTLYFHLQRGSGKKACVNGNVSDCDGDGVEGESERLDTDGDGLPNNCDTDSDGDEIPDGAEWKGQPTDLDNDGKPDHLDADADGDGLSDDVDPEISNSATRPTVRVDNVAVEAPCGPVQRIYVRIDASEPVSEVSLGLVWKPADLDILAIEPGPDVAAKNIESFKAFVETQGPGAGEAFSSLDLRLPLPPGRDLRLFALDIRAAAGAEPKLRSQLCTANNVGDAANDTAIVVVRNGSPVRLTPAPACGTIETIADQTPPVFVALPGLVIPCVVPGGNKVELAVSAKDDCGPVKVTTIPASGSIFPAGVTTIFCRAEDSSGNVAVKTFDVFVGDILPPRFLRQLPPLVNATSPEGTPVEYRVDVQDDCGVAALECTPPSGSTFPVGTTIVHCVARDFAGNEATHEFPVTVRAGALFIRGDCDGNGRVGGSVNDAVVLFLYNFTGGAEPPCLAACDANADGRVTGQVTDGVYLLSFSFLGGPPPPVPFPKCGPIEREGDLKLGCKKLAENCGDTN